GGPTSVVGDLESAPFVAGNPVYETSPVIRPDGQRLLGKPLIARGCAEEKDLLTGGAHAVADDVREQAPEPRAAGEDECIGDEGGAVGQLDAPQLAFRETRAGLRCELAVFTAFGEEALEHGGAGPARRQVPTILLEDGPTHLLAVDLRVPAREWPGPQASTRVTRAPRRRRWSAVQPPNAPAPTTATCRCLLIGSQPFSKGDAPSAARATAQDSRNDRREMRLTPGRGAEYA